MEPITPSRPGHVFAEVSGWEVECCGSPFRVGDLVDADLYDYLAPAAQELFTPLEQYWSWHDDRAAPRVRARVVNLWEVWWELRQVGERAFETLTGRGRAIGVHEVEIDVDRQPSGWVVELAPVVVLPHAPGS